MCNLRPPFQLQLGSCMQALLNRIFQCQNVIYLPCRGGSDNSDFGKNTFVSSSNMVVLTILLNFGMLRPVKLFLLMKSTLNTAKKWRFLHVQLTQLNFINCNSSFIFLFLSNKNIKYERGICDEKNPPSRTLTLKHCTCSSPQILHAVKILLKLLKL